MKEFDLARSTVITFAAVVAGWAVIGAAAPNTVAPAITRTQLQRSDVPGTDLETRLYLIVYPPGTEAPVHHHPVTGLGYILEGSARSGYEGEEPVTLVAGQSFEDRVQVPHKVFANADTQHDLKFLIAYTVRKGDPVILTP